MRQSMNKIEGYYTPTILQSAIDDPLRSEQRINEFFPRVLSRAALFVLFITIVLFIPNASILHLTHRALVPLLGFFAGLCAWFPGVLVLLSAAASILTLIQGIGVQLGGTDVNWLATTWQQGIVVIGILLLSGWLCTLPLKLLIKAAKVVILLYVASIFIVGLAGIVCLLSGHTPQPSLTTSTLGFGGQNIFLYAGIFLLLLSFHLLLHM